MVLVLVERVVLVVAQLLAAALLRSTKLVRRSAEAAAYRFS